MAKERLNVTVDPDVKRQVQERNDINVSGAVNDYLKRRLMGETEDDAMLQIKIERHEEQAKKHEEEAEKHRQKAETYRNKLHERQQERREKLQEAVELLRVKELSSTGPYIATEDAKVEALAEDAGVSPDELRQAAIAQYQNDSDTDSTQRHYQ